MEGFFARARKITRARCGLVCSCFCARGPVPGVFRGVYCMNRLFLALAAASIASAAFAKTASAAPKLWAVTGTTGAGTGSAPGQSARLWGELGFHDQDAFTLLTTEIGVGLMVTPQLELEGVLPYTVLFPSGDADNGTSLGNIYLGINGFAGGRVRWSGGIGLPTASPDGSGGGALGAAAGIHGLQDLYLWFRDTLSLVGRVRVEAGSSVLFAVDGAAYFLIPTGDEDADRNTEFVLQPAGELGFRLSSATTFGARVSATWVTTGDADDNAQASLTPFVRHDFGSGFFSAQLVMNLDEPLGFAFDDGGYWGLFLGLGGGF
jgi:hypothetical protein